MEKSFKLCVFRNCCVCSGTVVRVQKLLCVFRNCCVCSGEAEVQIRITDKNDNAPYFKKLTYNARVPENTDIGTIVISVTAEDKDKGMNHYITNALNAHHI